MFLHAWLFKPVFFQITSKDGSRFIHQGNNPGFPAFACQRDLCRHGQPDILHLEIRKFLDTGGAIVQQAEECQISPPFPCTLVWCGQKQRRLLLSQILYRFLWLLLERYGQYLLTLEDGARLLRLDIPEQCMYRGKPLVPGTDAVAPG